jgi:hypothetical protein
MVFDSLPYKEDAYQQFIDILTKERQPIAIINNVCIGYTLNCITNFCLCILKVCIVYIESMVGSTLKIGKNCWQDMPNT